jgi:peptide/nickel transport system permease protein
VVALLRFIIKRILVSLLAVWAISIVTFLIFFAVPASPAEAMCGKDCTPERIAAVNRALGMDKPILQQYIDYHKGIFVGRELGIAPNVEHCTAPCFGFSFHTREQVTPILARALPVTVSLILGGAIMWLTIGIAMGMISALKRGTGFDKFAIGFSLVGASMPIFFFALILLGVLVFGLQILPYPQWVPFTENPLKWASGLILPWVALGMVNSAQYARLTRSQLLESLSEDYIRTARAIGLRKRTVHLRHAFRAVLAPIVTQAGLDIGTGLGGVVITETIFGMPGIGYQAVRAAPELNLPVIMATVLIAAVGVVAMNTIVDVLYAVIDPRVRLS